MLCCLCCAFYWTLAPLLQCLNKSKGKEMQEKKEHLSTSGSQCCSGSSEAPCLITLLPKRCTIQAWQSDSVSGCHWSHCKLLQNISSAVYCDAARNISPDIEAFEIKHLKLLGIFGYHFSYVFFPFLLHQVNTTCFREKLKIESILLVKLWNTEYLQETSIVLGISHKKVNICAARLAIVSLIMFLLLFA